MQTQQTQPTPRTIPTAQQVFFAGIGAMSLLRKNSAAALQEAVAIAGRTPKAASIMIEGLGEQGRRYRDQVLTRANGLGQRVVTVAGELAGDAQARLQPVLRKLDDVGVALGIMQVKRKSATKTARKGRKPAAKVAARRKTRKAA